MRRTVEAIDPKLRHNDVADGISIRRRALLVGLQLLPMVLLACSADSAPLVEPTLTTPGAFIAVPFDGTEGNPGGAAGGAGAAGAPPNLGAAGGSGQTGRVRLIRVLLVLDIRTEQAIFHFDYGVMDSLARARAAARQRSSGPPPSYFITSLSRLRSRAAVVVGYRSLTDEEREAIR